MGPLDQKKMAQNATLQETFVSSPLGVARPEPARRVKPSLDSLRYLTDASLAGGGELSAESDVLAIELAISPDQVAEVDAPGPGVAGMNRGRRPEKASVGLDFLGTAPACCPSSRTFSHGIVLRTPDR